MKNKYSQIIEYLIFLLLGMLIAFIICNKKIPEDVNNDGKVNSKDLFLVKKYLREEGK